jgi:hypothetical protein
VSRASQPLWGRIGFTARIVSLLQYTMECIERSWEPEGWLALELREKHRFGILLGSDGVVVRETRSFSSRGRFEFMGICLKRDRKESFGVIEWGAIVVLLGTWWIFAGYMLLSTPHCNSPIPLPPSLLLPQPGQAGTVTSFCCVLSLCVCVSSLRARRLRPMDYMGACRPSVQGVAKGRCHIVRK